jgi:hypothetical protein
LVIGDDVEWARTILTDFNIENMRLADYGVNKEALSKTWDAIVISNLLGSMSHIEIEDLLKEIKMTRYVIISENCSCDEEKRYAGIFKEVGLYLVDILVVGAQ